MYERKVVDQGINAKKTARYLTKIAGLTKGSIIVVTAGDYEYSIRPSMRFITEEEHKEIKPKIDSIYQLDIPIDEKVHKHTEIINDLRNKNFDRTIDSYLNKHLVNNHATIIGVYFYIISEEYKPSGHAIVAYKRNDKIEFFH